MKQNGNLAKVSYTNELCANVHPCDMLANGDILASVLAAFVDSVSQVSTTCLSNSKTPPSTSASSSSILLNLEFPLIYIDIRSIRVLLPTCHCVAEPERSFSTNNHSSSKGDGPRLTNTDGCGIFDPDIIMLQIISLVVAPNADNPLPRTIVNRSKDISINNYLITDNDDRQYQLDINSISLCTGRFYNVC